MPKNCGHKRKLQHLGEDEAVADNNETVEEPAPKKPKIAPKTTPQIETTNQLNDITNKTKSVTDTTIPATANEIKNDYYLMAFDTEVNGWRQWFRGQVDPESRIAELGWSIFDKSGNKIKTQAFYIKPNQWIVNEQQMEKYGITNQLLNDKGIPFIDALNQFNNDFQKIIENHGFIAVHKIGYDTVLMNEEIKRIEKNKETMSQQKQKEYNFNDLKNWLNPQSNKKIINTHRIDILKQLNNNPNFIKNMHTLSENEQRNLAWFPNKKWGAQLGILHKALKGGNKSEGAHHAGVDAELTAEVIFELKKFGINLFE